MAAAMLAAYPDIYAAGASVAGMPVGSARSAMQALLRMSSAGNDQRADGGHRRVLDHRGVVSQQVIQDRGLRGVFVAPMVRVDSPLQRDGQQTATQRAGAGGAPCGHDCIEHGQTISGSGSTGA